VLFATSVAEEGMDIPSANCVIRFDAIQTPVSLVQSRGRARQQDSSFVVMAEIEGRSCSTLLKSEESQISAISKLSSSDNLSSELSKEMLNKKIQAQSSRIRGAKPIIDRFIASLTSSSSTLAPLGTLKQYSQKVAGEVTENAKKNANSGLFEAIVTLNQFNVPQMTGQGVGENKKIAINEAARDLLQKI
jgi:superfamily II DNA/RNA helicase